MISQWSEYKEAAISLRLQGHSLKAIRLHLGVPLSTLSGWLRTITLDEQQKQLLKDKQKAALLVARQKAADWHRSQKALRLHKAKQQAQEVLDTLLPPTAATLDLALAMLYFGEGAKTKDRTTIASSDPLILQTVIKILRLNYGLSLSAFKCELHLRMDQNAETAKMYWSKNLNLPIDQFSYIAFDKRTANKATYPTYHGVCVLNCGNVAIQRKLVYLYTLFCEKIATLDLGT